MTGSHELGCLRSVLASVDGLSFMFSYIWGHHQHESTAHPIESARSVVASLDVVLDHFDQLSI